jgi:hypothetical protein
MSRVFTPPVPRTRHRSLRRFQARPRLEELETRTLLAAYTPAQIRSAYGITGDGAGQTIAIVDAYFDPTITSDLASFSSRYGLAQLDGTNGDGTFRQVDLTGNKTPSPRNDDWTLETALDVEWAHAVAPLANIVLVEANSDTQDPFTGEPTDLLNAVQYAATQTGASVVSMSWGLTEVPNETQWDSFFNVPGVTFVAASGDSGAGTIWPATSPYVVGVGGSTLRLNSANNISSETGWGSGSLSFFFGGSGGGFSQYESLPSYQQSITTTENGFPLTSFGKRLSPDVAYDANPSTGFRVLDGADGGWFTVGGTSAGAPQWAALIAIADAARAAKGLGPLSSTQTLTALYGIYNSTAYANDFNAITSGSTGAYQVVNSNNQVIGMIPVAASKNYSYNLVTGLGTPKATQLVADLAISTSTVGPLVSKVATGSSASAGSSNSSGGSTNTHPRDLPTSSGSTTAATSDLSTFQAVQVLTSAAGLQATPAPATPGSNGSTPALVVVPTAPRLPVLSAASSAVLLSKNNGGGGGDDLADQDDPSVKSQPAVPAAPADSPAAPPAVPTRQKVHPEPVVPAAADALLLQPASLPELFDGSEWDAPPIEDTRLESRPGLNAVLLGLATSLVLLQHGPSSRPEARDRRYPGVKAAG